jgi:hypothetical protein
MTEKFNTIRGKRGLDFTNIRGDVVQFATQIVSCKLIRKYHKDEVPTTIIATMKNCIEGVYMNWATFFVNQFLVDFTKAQEKGTKFHYAWTLILIALVTWREPDECQFLKTSCQDHGTMRYVNS